MHKLLIDINVVLDVALARAPHSKSSEKILSYIEKGKAEGYVSAISCTTLYKKGAIQRKPLAASGIY